MRGTAVLVAVGGAAGTLARYGVSRIASDNPDAWPWGTFAANLVGAFLLGLLVEALARREGSPATAKRLRLLLGTGFCGGLTTFSTLAVETDLLARGDRAELAITYLAVSVAAGVVVAVAGMRVGHRTGRA